MTTKIISSYVASGYTLSPSYSELSITSTGGVGGTGIYAAQIATVVNAGEVHAGGIDLNEGGAVVNGQATQTGATIIGTLGVDLDAAGTVANYGTIDGANLGVIMRANGDLTNGSAADAAALTEGYTGVLLQGAGAVTNFGTILGTGANVGAGAFLSAGDNLTNGASGEGSALIKGGRGVYASGGGSVTNYGTIWGTAGDAVLFESPNEVLVVEAGSAFVGSVNGGGGTLELAGGVGTITGLGGAATVSGAVSMSFSDFGSYVLEPGTGWTLTGVNALEAGKSLSAGGDVTNLGSLTSAGPAGIYLTSGGSLTNAASASIEGAVGVYAVASGAATVSNFGTIEGTGGTAVQFESAADRLIAEPGSDFIGAVAGGGGTLELAGGAGTITGLGADGTLSGAEAMIFSGFGSYVIDAGGSWTVKAGDYLGGAANIGAAQTLANSGVLILSGELVDAGALANDAGGLVTLDDGSLAEVGGAVTNAGTIVLDGGGAATGLRLLGGGATLSGGGTVTLSGTTARIWGTTASATLANVDNTIIGAGHIGLGEMTLDNASAGLIEAFGGQLVVDTAGETLTNAGLLEATAGSDLVLAGTTVDQSAGGTVLATGRVYLEDDDIIGGAVGSSGSGLVLVNVAGGEFDGSEGAVTLTGLIEVLNGSNLILNGAIVNDGKLNATPAATRADLIIGAAGATLSGGGEVNLTNANNRVYGQSAADTLTNVDDRIAGAGQLGNGTLTLVNDAGGVIVGNTTAGLTIDTGASTIINAGEIAAVAGAVTIRSPIANTGNLFAGGGTITLDGVVSGAGAAQISGGTLDAASTFDQNVTFNSAKGVFELAHSQTYTGTIADFSRSGGTSLDLQDISFTKSVTVATFTGTSTSGVLTVTNGTQTAKIKLDGDYLHSTFATASDGHGGTTITDPTATASTHGFIAAMAALAPSVGVLLAQTETRRPAASLMLIAHRSQAT